MITRYLAIVSYDGTNYSGFQKQKNGTGIQNKIERALKNMTDLEIAITSAGRTDKGVHALGQAFHFDLPFAIETTKLITEINKRLNPDIKIKSIKKVREKFHSRYDAKIRVYEYRVAKKESDIFSERFETYVKNFDVEKAIEASKYFIGKKDFTSFSKGIENKNPVRVIHNIEVKETKKQYIFIFWGESFLRHMIRSIMGVIIMVATNKKSVDDIEKMFIEKDNKLVSKKAEAKGLFFKKIIY